MIKYVLCPGFVTSKTDRDKHWISADKLIQLYGVNRQECIMFGEKGFDYKKKGLIFLAPRYNGDYEVSKCPQQ